MNEIQLFNHDRFGEIRVLKINGEPWFVAKDICDALGYTNVTKTLNDHLENDERSNVSLGRQGMTNIISEPGLYGLILRSNKSEAREFSRWVKHDVLPQIRLTGNYRAKYVLADILEANKIIYEIAGLKDNQLTLAMDKIYQRHMGYSALTAAGIQLRAPELEQLLTPTEIGKKVGQSARMINALLIAMNYQRKAGRGYEPIGEGKNYGVMLDVGKRSSTGTPVRQLKWKSSIIGILK